MHLLAAQAQAIDDGSQAVDLGQSPGAIIVLSAADGELALLSDAQAALADPPSLRLANWMRLKHNASVDLYIETVLAKAELIVLRLLGGRAYWPYGLDAIVEAARAKAIPLAVLPGDSRPDPELDSASTVGPEARFRLWRYLVEGGAANARQFLIYAGTLIGRGGAWREPAPLPPAGLWWPNLDRPDLEGLRRQWVDGQAVAAILFYRALEQAGDTRPIAALTDALQKENLNPLPIFVTSLKDRLAAATLEALFAQAKPKIILSATSFALADPERGGESALAGLDRPVLQIVLASGDRKTWLEGTRGLSPRDLAMSVALPEVDGRILAGAVSFKEIQPRDPLTEIDRVRHVPDPDRVAFAAAQAASWVRLAETKPAQRRIALVLANYPNRDGRLGNGVGLDTPASTIEVLKALALAGYHLDHPPADGQALMTLLQEGPTNAFDPQRRLREGLALPDYQAFFRDLPQAVQEKVSARWGAPERDPHFRTGETDCGRFALPVIVFGNIAVAIQPARGYNIDPAASYHDPDLAPPHAYFAFHAWLRHHFRAQAVVHMGKHGNLEWLPGKAVALSESCFPEAALGPLPNLYPFIVNDPGEGTQAKRRAHAVIVDHLTPPLTRAETYGDLRVLERLVDEYYQAAGLDPRRLPALRTEILSYTSALGLDADLGIKPGLSEEESLQRLDNHLCELKELQIRDGLHVLGRSPEGALLADLLVALVRLPRGPKESLPRALAGDLGLGFDPLEAEPAQPWTGPKPEIMASAEPWRSAGDTLERLEKLARDLAMGTRLPDPSWTRTRAVLEELSQTLRPAVERSGAAEIAALLKGLDGGFVAPGPSGAPTRGRPEVLPTGRNFYSVDTRALPTPSAWTLGWKSAMGLIERHLQDHGTWPRRVALTAWGTSCMRTGGDDIAQGLALLGVRPTWDDGSGRLSGFEVMPAELLDRPRVDVTLRVSGFFRDAFPGLIDLFDSAVRAVAALNESEETNPLAARVRLETRQRIDEGATPDKAQRLAATRIFGSMPGAYGAGLQALIDEKGWESDADLARAYLAWGGFAYGAGQEGAQAKELFAARLEGIEAVVQNQDNREHDLLDSDDYYQFEGGLAAAVRVLSGQQPALYHPDHSRPERPRINTLEEEIARIVRGRAANPKWIAGAMRHGYKGAFEMAATLDYLFGFAATAKVVKDHQFDKLFKAYLEDERVRAFLKEANPAALREMAERFQEAIDRGLWQPRRNAVAEVLGGIGISRS
ncbi:MAG: cobaltochelatase subunit CobN [Rhodospirillales bacterium]|nr:cobaltochelatase subunit CobN [Rhodospirillales bacterium]